MDGDLLILIFFWPEEKSLEIIVRLKQVSTLARMWHCKQFDAIDNPPTTDPSNEHHIHHNLWRLFLPVGFSNCRPTFIFWHQMR